MKRLVLLAMATVLVANEDPDSEDATSTEQSEFVGRYNGSSFETAMGMAIRADGTFVWGLSVGALDLRAAGTWQQDGDIIRLTSDPKPVEPEFRFSGLETLEGAPLLRVVEGDEEEPFYHASAVINCAEGWTLSLPVPAKGLTFRAIENTGPPPQAVADEQQEEISCDQPESIALRQNSYNIHSKTFDLAELGWEPGKTVRIAFHPNDLGVADFTGVTGMLEDGKLKLVGGEWPLELRKLPPRPAAE